MKATAIPTTTAIPTVTTDPTSDHSSTATTSSRCTPRSVISSAWAVPIMVLGQFAFLAAIPIVLVLVLGRVLHDPHLRALRAPASLLAAVYAIPLALWLLNPNRAPSLSKDISPGFVALIVAASALLLTTIWFNRRPRTPTTTRTRCRPWSAAGAPRPRPPAGQGRTGRRSGGGR